MNRPRTAACNRFAVLAILATVATVGVVSAVPMPEMSWRTLDCGGGLTATNEMIELTTTIGQPDVGVTMTAAGIELTGGFWVGATSTPAACTCPGDVMPDSFVDGDDIQAFVDCAIGGGNCACADMNGDSVVDMTDVTLFVDRLFGGVPCP